MIIGMCGLKGSGKNTVANIIKKNYPNWTDASFAKALKDGVAVLFGLDRALLEGDTLESREWREKPNEFWCEKFGSSDVTPRKILQVFGTDLIRNTFLTNFWVDRLELDIKNLDEGKNIIITDVRFPNEVEMIKKHGGQIWHVHCGELPEWFTKYQNTGEIPPAEIHESEWRWAKSTPDVIIHPPHKDIDLLEKLVKEEYEKQFK